MQAAGALFGGFVTRGLQQTGVDQLTLDVVSIQPSGEGGANQLTLGRYLTHNLFVSYGQTLNSTGQKSFNAEYFLTKRWALLGVAGSGEGNYLDLLFRYPLNHGKEGVAIPLQNSPFRNTLDAPATLNNTLPLNNLPPSP
jgi:autotransporter translocation and assembly factor TamB